MFDLTRNYEEKLMSDESLMSDDNLNNHAIQEQKPDYDRQANVYIADLLGKFGHEHAIKVASSVSADKGEIFKQRYAKAIEEFKVLSAKDVLKKAFNSGLVFDPLFDNPKFDFNNSRILSDIDAESFFKDTLQNKQADNKSLFFLLSTKGFIEKIRPETVRLVMKQLIEDKKALFLKYLLSSEDILAKIDNAFMQKFISEARTQDPVIIRDILALDGFYQKFTSFLQDRKDDEIYKLFKEASNGLLDAISRFLQEDDPFHNRVTETFVAKLPKTTINAELTTQNNAYFKLLYQLPEVSKVYVQNVADLKNKLAVAAPIAAHTFLKALNGEAVKLVFPESPNEIDNKILQNFLLAFQDSKIDQHIWFTTASNQVIEYLMKNTEIQSKFDGFLQTLQKNDVAGEQSKVDLFARELISKGKTVLFKAMMSNNSYHKSMGKPEGLIIKAVESKQPDILIALAGDEYFSGRSFKNSSPQKNAFLAKFESAVNLARIMKDYSLLTILFKNFPENYISPTLYEKFLDFYCQIADHPSFKSYSKPVAQENIESAHSAQTFPNPCDTAPSFEDLATGFDSKKVNFTLLQSNQAEQREHYNTLLLPLPEPKPENNTDSVASNNATNNSISGTLTNPQIIYVPVNKTVYPEKSFSTKTTEAAPYFFTSLIEGFGIYKLAQIDPMTSLLYPTINAFCQATLHCSTVAHGATHLHVAQYNKFVQNHAAQVKQTVQVIMLFQAVKLVLHTGDGILKLTSTFTPPTQEATDIVVVALSEAANALMYFGVVGAVAGSSSIALTSAVLSISAYGISHLVDKLTTNSPTPEEIIFQSNGSEKAAPTTTAPDPANVPENNPLHDDQNNENPHNEL